MVKAVSSGRRGSWWLYAVPWLPYLTMYLTAFVANGLPLGFALRGAFANVLPDALLGLAIVRVPRWLRWPEGRKGRFFATHVALLVGFVVAASIGWAALLLLDGLICGDPRTARLDFRPIPWRVLNDLLIYVALAGVGYAWQNAADGRERVARADALRARAQLEAMRSQLNPHFMLNTFHALVGLVRRDPAVAEEALEQLGDLLRTSLRFQREGLDEVTLRDEWHLVRSYLDLEHLRLGDRLRVSFDASDDCLDCLVPSFSVQTLVENSIRHAIAPRAAGGRLTIKITEIDDRLRIRVEDDGAGDDTVAAAAGESQGVGLRLLGDRLAALYEGRAHLELAVGAGGGAAILDLPARRLAEPA
jgi:signal transduction histidine kinase